MLPARPAFSTSFPFAPSRGYVTFLLSCALLFLVISYTLPFPSVGRVPIVSSSILCSSCLHASICMAPGVRRCPEPHSSYKSHCVYNRYCTWGQRNRASPEGAGEEVVKGLTAEVSFLTIHLTHCKTAGLLGLLLGGSSSYSLLFLFLILISRSCLHPLVSPHTCLMDQLRECRGVRGVD